MNHLDEITLRRHDGPFGLKWSAYYSAAPHVRGNATDPVRAVAALLDKVSDPEWLEIQRAIVIPQTDTMTL